MRHRKKIIVSYSEIISLDNLLLAWKNFSTGKKHKKDVQEFGLHLMDNLIELHQSLKEKTYTHGPYHAFKVNDPKPRDIHKARVRDRVVHHLLYQSLAPYFFRRFIHDSYSCQDRKGVHRAIKRFETFSRQVSKNHTQQCFVLKCDIRKFFASIDQGILLKILEEWIEDQDVLWLLERIIRSFSLSCHLDRTTSERRDSSVTLGMTSKRGLPLGNLTSQLLVNIYMNEFDQFVKHKLKVKYYIRYADDFVIFSQDKGELETLLIKIQCLLKLRLNLELHPNKVSIETLGKGVDFLGWVHFLGYRVLRTVTKRRMLKRVNEKNVASYFGTLGWGNGWKLWVTVNQLKDRLK